MEREINTQLGPRLGSFQEKTEHNCMELNIQYIISELKESVMNGSNNHSKFQLRLPWQMEIGTSVYVSNCSLKIKAK